MSPIERSGAVTTAAPIGPAGGDLAGTYPSPSVAAITETNGPQQLTIGNVLAGQYLRRSGVTLVGSVAVHSVAATDASIIVTGTANDPTIAAAVASVFARTGAVVAAAGDYLASQVTNAADKISTSIQSFAAGVQSTHSSQGVGYATGAGGAVTQITSKATAVTLNKICGQITMFNGALASGASVSFGVQNTAYRGDLGDTVVLGFGGGTAASLSYTTIIENHQTNNANFRIRITNVSAGSLSEAVIINFAVIKAVAA